MVQSKDDAFRTLLRLIGSLSCNLIVQFKESKLDGVIGVDQIGNFRELGIVHIEQVILDPSLIDDVGFRLQLLAHSRQLESAIVAREIRCY